MYIVLATEGDDLPEAWVYPNEEEAEKFADGHADFNGDWVVVKVSNSDEYRLQEVTSVSR
jgi:hypothetical protein